MFNFEMSSKLIFGIDCVKKLSEILTNLDCVKVLLVCDKPIRSTGIADSVIEQIEKSNSSYFIIDEVEPNPTDIIIKSMAEKCRDHKFNCIVAVGGGSVLDSAKAINILLNNPKEIKDYEGMDNVKSSACPLIAIPTTAGTGSEITSFTIVTDTTRKKKMVIGGKNVGATIALVDPNLTVKLPAMLTASTGMDALTHAVEAYVSKIASPASDVFALEAAKKIFNSLEKCVKNPTDIEARAEVMLGATLAGIAFDNAVLGLAHAIAHPLGAHYNIPHGIANAMVLAEAAEFNSYTSSDKLIYLGKYIGITKENLTSCDIVDAIRELTKKVGIPSLGDYIKDKSININKDVLVKAVLEEPSLGTNPSEVKEEDVITILNKLLN